MQLIDADALVDELLRMGKAREQSGEPLLMADVLWCMALAMVDEPDADTEKRKKNVNSSNNS